ncbi:hypothetical protein RRG08_005278 [Elysia crispata]|uniref:PiggyBac transposable element-derived protein domain-containing protein n=1 Tax=Elysia crispata TaxID=231223 RepID=A0AAE0YCN1_9GAST|nr:hypothetical protein RRG08_005278 [Elysia crispata]
MAQKKSDETVREVVDFFISTKGGVDCLDLMAHSMTTKRQTKRWPMFVFFHILDMASNVIFKIKFPEHKLPNQDNRRLFQLDIAMSFLLPQIERRRLLNNLPIQLTTSMDLVLDTKKVTPAATVSAPKRKRCAKCPSKADKRHSWLVANAISPSAKTTLHIIVWHVLVDNRNSLTS